MSSRPSRTLALLAFGVIALASAATAGADVAKVAPADGPLKLRYSLSLAGLPVAQLILRHDLDDGRYRSRVEIETIGIAERLSGYESEALAKGKIPAEALLVPSSYRLDSRSSSKTRRVRVRFDPATGDVAKLELKKRGNPDRSKVPADLQLGVIDPLTAFFRLRDYVADSDAATAQTGPFAAAVFDGRRRYDVDGRIIGRDQVRIGGRQREVVRVDMGLRPRAGFNDNDLERAGERERYSIEVLFSDDDRALPLRMITREWLITASIDLVEDCSSSAGCRLAQR